MKNAAHQAKIAERLLTEDIAIFVEDKTEFLLYLLAQGAGVDCASDHGMTPLCFAAAHGATKCANILLEQGANLEHATKDGETPLWWACYEGMQGAAHESTSRERRLVHAQARRELLTLLLERGANPNIYDSAGDTPLRLLAGSGDTAEAALLLTHGAEVDLCGPDSETPLFRAIELGNAEMIRLLIQHGANPQRVTRKGRVLENVLVAGGRHFEGGKNALSDFVRGEQHNYALQAVTAGKGERMRI